MAGEYRGYPSRRAYDNAKAREQGYASSYERSKLGRIAVDLGIREKGSQFAPKPVINEQIRVVREEPQRRNWIQESFFGQRPWSLEIHPYTNSVHYVYSIEFTEENIREANRQYLEIINEHMREFGAFQVRIYGLFIEYAGSEPEPSGDAHWRGLPGIATTEYLREFPTIAHVANELGAFNPERLEIIYIAPPRDN